MSSAQYRGSAGGLCGKKTDLKDVFFSLFSLLCCLLTWQRHLRGLFTIKNPIPQEEEGGGEGGG